MAFMPIYAWSVSVYEPCLNYYQAGLSGCTSVVAKPSPTAKVLAGASPSAVVAAPPAAPESLDQKIDKFLKDQGKPPREFIAFYLEPTQENALKWAYKFQELQQRNIQITEAWTQAEQLVIQAQARGQNISSLASETLPPVQPLTGPLLDWNNLSGEGLAGTLALPVANTGALTGQLNPLPNPLAALTGQANGQANGLAAGGLAAAGLGLPFQLPPSSSIPARAAPVIPHEAPDSFNITYYFSSECPYCEKFEPEFVQLKFQLGSRLNISCVDVSPPGAPAKTNLETSLGCAVRKPQNGEIEKMGLKTTPTLIVRRGNATMLDRINGYVPIDKLKAWLLTGKAPNT